MSTAPSQAPAPTRAGVLRTWFPLFVLALTALAGAVIWGLPDGVMERLARSMASFAVVGATLLALLCWILFFAPFRRGGRMALLAAFVLALGAFVGSVQAGLLVVDFDGDLVPSFRLARRLPQEPSRAVPATEDLSGHGTTAWPEYRGRQRGGVVTGPALATDWSARTPRWRKPVGDGHSSVAVAGNVAFTLEQRDYEEAVVCYNVATGAQYWIHSYPARFMEQMGGPGPRSTPTIIDNEVYALGATGTLVCLAAHTGKAKWTADILKNNANVRWGMTGSPLVFDDVVVVNPGTQTAEAAGTLAAYDRKTGELRWSSGRGSAGYSSPMLATLGGKRQILLFDGEGLSGYDPADRGKQLWRYPWPVQERINASQPLVLGGDRVLISSGYGVGSAVLQIKQDGGKWTVEPIWQNRKMRCKFSSPVLHEDHVYGLDEGILVCLNVKTGERKWRGERYGHGQMLLTDGHLVITSEDGELALVKATPDGYQELTRIQAIEGRTWNLPALADGLALVRNHREMACYDLRAKRQQAVRPGN